ncbi:MAG: hypothetical protein H7Y86_03810 [Rhizobacter sp.]|nr:hypothetical protein [Ferruginibacter sp.]
MKKIIVGCFAFFHVFVASAQTKETVFTAMATELCKEIKSKQAELKASDDMQVELGLMMMPVFLKYEADIKKVMPKFDYTDSKQLETLGMEVGKKLISCPEFLSLVSSNKDMMAQSTKEGTAVLQLEGTVTGITPGDFTSLSVKTASGKVEKIWWMEYFPGDDKLIGGSLVNKKVTIKYTEKEIYNAGMKTYVKIKVAAGVE